MKPIRIIIISIFVLSLIFALLLFRQKSGRIKEQLEKKELGWHPVSVKKIKILSSSKDTLIFTKSDGVWKSNARFDGMGVAPQIILYLSTIQIEKYTGSEFLDSSDKIILQTFDKSAALINTIEIGKDLKPGTCIARINSEKELMLLHSNLNNKSLKGLLDSIAY